MTILDLIDDLDKVNTEMKKNNESLEKSLLALKNFFPPTGEPMGMTPEAREENDLETMAGL